MSGITGVGAAGGAGTTALGQQEMRERMARFPAAPAPEAGDRQLAAVGIVLGTGRVPAPVLC